MIRKWQRSMGWVLSIVMMLSLVYVTPIQARGSEALLLNVSQMDNATMTSNTEVNGFLIKAAADKAVVVDASSKTASDGTVFAKRLKLGGTGSADSRSVHFTVTGKSEVKVYAMSSSGDADRELGLFQFDGTEIGTMEAFGAKLESNIFTVSAGDYYLASKSSGVNIYQVEVIPTPEIEVKTLGISSMEIGDLIENTERNGFTLVATADKKITVDANAKTASDGASFSQRLKLNGAGTVSERSVHFSVSAESEVKVYAMSGSSSADRKLGLYRLDDSLVGTMQTLGASLEVTTFSVPAGEFYLASMESGINIYEVIVTTGEPAEIIRKAWNEVAAPVLTGVTQEGNQVHVAFNLITGVDGADKANVYMYDEEGLIVDSIIVGNSLSEQKVASFTIADSGSYEFQVEAVRNEETETKLSGKDTINYLLPLDKPVIRAFNQLDGSILVKWFSVKEAQSYRVEAKVANTSGPSIVVNALSEEAMIPSGELEEGSQYEIKVIALRASDESASESIFKTMKKEAQREWNFTYFGQSVSSSRNVMNMLDEENLRFELKSCTIKPDGVTIDGKGGKFTTFHDGISYYYTVIDPTTENFELTATFHVDYINSTPDGQEGFGLLAMDSIGAYGVSNVNHYTNSAGIIATKFEETIEGVKYTGKDVIGSRFVSGITTEVLNAGDSGIAQAARNQSKGYGYLEDDLVKTGDSYTLTLKKTNTGYHTLYNGEERTLYGVEKLLQLDSEHLYVGFAVARGANVTVSDVRFTTSNPLMDPPAMEEPAEMVSYMKKIDSPTTSGVKDYTFVYVADVPGTLTVLNENGSKLVDEESIQKGIDFTKQFQLQFGVNHYTVKFTPQADYVPGDNQILDSYETVTTEHQVIFRSFPGSSIYVSPTGKDTNSGSSNSPVDLHTAIAYVKAGQTIVLEGGTYEMKSSVVVPRGIDGKENAYIGLRAKADQRAIFDFSQAGGGMSLWGDYWYVENIDITKTPGNVKGLQVAGSHNMIVRVDAYRNGDTGIQISGTGAETIEKWPAHNLILNCTSYDNMDPGQNNADGFAAKITVAEGNIFRGCIAHNNLDDGWDLFAKIESGPIGAVIIENSIAYNNGTLTDGIGNGDGNGFKLGGDGIAVAHVLRNSISYNNNTNGVTSNSNPSAVIENVTSYGNKGRNLSLYGKGSGERFFAMSGMLSMAGGGEDDISEMPSLASENNYLSNGTQAINSLSESVDQSIFIATDLQIQPEREEDGSIDMNGLLGLKAEVFNKAGATLMPTPVTLPSFMKEETMPPNPPTPSIPSTPTEPTNTENGSSSNEETEETSEIKDDLPPQVIEYVSGQWFEAAYRNLYAKGVILGDEAPKLEKKVLRQQSLSYLIRALHPELEGEEKLLEFAVEKGWIKGFGKGDYGMDQNLTREQAMVIVARILRQGKEREEKEVDVAAYEDWNQISEWAKEDILYLMRAGIIRGKSSTIIDPKSEMTLIEILVMIERLLQ